MAHVRYPDPDLARLFQSAMLRSERFGTGPLISALRTAEIVLPELRGMGNALESAISNERDERWIRRGIKLSLGGDRIYGD